MVVAADLQAGKENAREERSEYKVLKVSVGRAGTEDYMAWNYNKNRVFSVRSAYHLKQQLKREEEGRASSSFNLVEHKGWLSLWSAQVPNKVTVHCWRLAKNGPAVGEELQRRSIKQGVKCIACARDETLVHRFWSYEHSQQVWEHLRSMTSLELKDPLGDIRTPRGLQSWLLDWFVMLDENELALALLAIYQVWLARNNVHELPMIDDPMAIVRRVLALAVEWKEVHSMQPKQATWLVERWRPPANGWHKGNADGEFYQKEGHGGGGAIIRDQHGSFVAGACHFFSLVSDLARAELLACKRTIQLALEMQVQKLELGSDCASVVSKLKDLSWDRSVDGYLVEEVKHLLYGFDDWTIRHVQRWGNTHAHNLAKEGCMNKLVKTWVGIPPIFISSVLEFDVEV